MKLFIASYEQIQYFAFTQKEGTNYDKYYGSGVDWVPIMKNNEKPQKMIIFDSVDQQILSEFALGFSAANGIVDSNLWANKITETAIPGRTRPLSPETKLKLSEVSKGVSWNEKYGIEFANKKREQHRKILLGRKMINNFSEETLQKISDKTKKMWNSEIGERERLRRKKECAGEGNHFYGKIHTNETRVKMVNKWKLREMIVCPYCGITSNNKGNMNRWHFNNCKNKKEK